MHKSKQRPAGGGGHFPTLPVNYYVHGFNMILRGVFIRFGRIFVLVYVSVFCGLRAVDAEALAALQVQKNQLLEASQTLPDPSAHSSLPGLFRYGIDDKPGPGDSCDECTSSAQQVQQMQRFCLQCFSSDGNLFQCS